MNASPLVLSETVSEATFDRLRSLWQQLGQALGSSGMLVTSANLQLEAGESPFYLLLTSDFAALLLVQPSAEEDSYLATISVSIPYITDFLGQFLEKNAVPPLLGQALAQLQSLGATFVEHLTSDLQVGSGKWEVGGVGGVGRGTTFMADFLFEVFSIIYSQPCHSSNVCRPLENALFQQIEQEKLLNQVVSQIRQSLELPIVLETAVREVRNFLQVDRLIIYEFIEEVSSLENFYQGKGRVSYESKVSNTIPSILNLEAEDACFSYIPSYREKYRKGNIVAVEDVENNYSSSFCLAEFLRCHGVRSKLVAPIVVQDELWGLIIAHQCQQSRHWTESEIQFLGRIGEHLAIAIYQAQLYAQVQQQKNLFEQRVIERTQELYDTMIAAEAANLSKHEFLSNMSHELLTPLTCIIGLSGTLQRWPLLPNSLSPEKQQKYLKTIEENGKKLQELINDILDFSQISVGKVILEIQDISLKNLSNNIINILQPEAQQKQITLELDFKVEEAQDIFFADQERVQKILLHLLRNALKFTPESGRVILRVWREYNQVVFQVEDTGIGIPEEQISTLFETFQQLEKSRQRTHGGIGLGLALSKQLVELHQGTIEVESSVDQGSVFTIRLPNQSQRKPNSNRGVAVTHHQIKLFKKTIVLISNDEEMANLVCDLLTADNYQIIWLIDSYLSNKKIEIIEPNLVILDDQSPEIFSISQALKKSTKMKYIKILLLHNPHITFNWKSLRISGLDDYIIKPIQPYLLLEKVRYLLSLA